MQQIYHSNAKTNINIRRQIKENNSSSNKKLAQRFATSPQTISRWKNRNFQTDISSRPKNIKYALSVEQQALLISIRGSTWFSLDEVWEMLQPQAPNITRSSVYRCFKSNNINTIPEKQKEMLKKFKEYEPGYLHVDVTYLPK